MMNSQTWQRKYQKMGFLGMPDEVIVTLGKGVEADRLCAFDKAELDAGIPDINAMYVTSFVPPGATLIEPGKSEESKAYLAKHPVVPGSLVPTALKSCTSNRKRQLKKGFYGLSIFAAIALLGAKEKDRFPTIMMEYAGPEEEGDPATEPDVREYCNQMSRRVAALREDVGFVPDGDPRVYIVEAQLPEDGKWACVLAAGLYVQRVLY